MGHVDGGTGADEFLAQFRIDQGEENQSRLFADVVYGAGKLAGTAHQRIEVLVYAHAFELGKCRTCDSIECFASRVRDKMDVKFDGFAIHRFMLHRPHAVPIRYTERQSQTVCTDTGWPHTGHGTDWRLRLTARLPGYRTNPWLL